MTFLMLVADLLGFAVAACILLVLDRLSGNFELGLVRIELAVVFLVGLSLFSFSRLYPGVGVSPVEEMRLVSQYLATAFLIGLFLLAFFHGATQRHYLTFFLAWALLPACILLSRWELRVLGVRRRIWGEPVAVLGAPAEAARLAAYFIERRRLGFEPVLVITLQPSDIEMPVPAISLQKASQSAARFSEEEIETLIVDPSAVLALQKLARNRKLFEMFKSILLVSDLEWLGGASLFVNDFEGLVGMEAQQNSLRPSDLLAKRLMDLVLGSLLGLVTLPLILLAALLIKLDSPGPVIYSQERLGKGGRCIRVYKLRSMHVDAEVVLENYLAANPQARLEWDRYQKLKEDPRVTPVGKWLREFSIDELPQIYNILRGEMSLVGPRPLPGYHHSLLSENLRLLRSSVRPGLTGMWQVTGRSNNGNHELEHWDAYYVHNWSLWLDLYILLRTAWVVLNRDGAY